MRQRFRVLLRFDTSGMKKGLLLLFIFLPITLCYTQSAIFKNNFKPNISHYSRADFQADAQFWAMTTDLKGNLYFGNNDGVVIYDGERWEKISLPNNSSVRSLITTDEGTIYAGGYNELGIIERDSTNSPHYVSLIEDLKLENQNFENLWQVHQIDDYIIFRTFNELIVLNDKKATHISSKEAFIYSYVIDNKLYVQDLNNGIFQFDYRNLRLEKIFSNEEIQGKSLVNLMPLDGNGNIAGISMDGNFFIGNLNSNEIRLEGSIFRNERKDRVISAIPYKDYFLLGTLSSNILVLDKKGNITDKIIALNQNYDSSVLNLYKTKEGNVWSLLNNGLDFIEFNSPVSHAFRDAAVYDALLDKKNIYLATNKGVYASTRSPSNSSQNLPSFKRIEETEGQAWSIQKINGDIIVGHDKGLLMVNGTRANTITDIGGFWKVIAIPNQSNKFLACNYNGFYLLNYSNETWTIEHKIQGFDESTRDIIYAGSDNTFWVCHGYKGIYKIKIDSNLERVFAMEHFTDQNGLKSPYNVNVTKWNGEIIFTTNTGIYTFNDSTNVFEKHPYLNNILDPSRNTRKLFQNDKKAWFVQDDEVGFFKIHENSPILYKNLFANLKGNLIRGMETILPYQKNEVLIGATNGLFIYQLDKKETTHPIETQITQVFYMDSTKQKILPLHKGEKTILSNNVRTLQFEYAVPAMSSSVEIQYAHKLEGIDKEWSSWNTMPFREYTHLPPGDYTFKVKSKNLLGNQGKVASFAFEILPAWYQTKIAILVYVFLFCLAVGILIFLVKKKIEKEKFKEKSRAEKTKKLLTLEIEQLKLKQEKERIRLDKKILEEDNIHKSKELANYTMVLMKKKDIFSETYYHLKEFRKTLKTQAAKKRLQEVIIKLNQHRIGEEYMKVFDVNFEKIHHTFFQRLKEIYPDITQRDLRLCAFIKMNLTNKEIAPLLNISVRGVETARYRVRKKLEVQDIKFSQFLEELVEE